MKIGDSCVEQFSELKHLAFLGRTSPAGFADRSLVSNCIHFGLGHDVHLALGGAIALTQTLQGRNGEEVVIQKKQGSAKRAGGVERLIDHLQHVGIMALLSRSVPAKDDFDTVLQVDEQGQAEPFERGADQNADRAKQMAEDVLALG